MVDVGTVTKRLNISIDFGGECCTENWITPKLKQELLNEIGFLLGLVESNNVENTDESNRSILKVGLDWQDNEDNQLNTDN